MTAEEKRAECQRLLAMLPTSGLDEALTALADAVTFWQERDAAPPSVPPTVHHGVGRVVFVGQRPQLILEAPA